MRAGQLDRRVTIQHFAESRDSFGASIENWITFAVVWARLEPGTGSESFGAEQRSSRQAAVWRVRFRPGLKPTMRVLHKSEVWEIESVSEPDRNNEVLLTCHAFEATTGG